MNIKLQDFNDKAFSFHDDPVLILEEFWTLAERKTIRDGMDRATWMSLKDMPQVYRDFPNCGNWKKSEIGQAEARIFLQRLSLSCIVQYMESFPNIIGRHMNFNYYSYAAGDALLTHDDTVQPSSSVGTQQKLPPLRRIAVVAYVHEEWQPDWGGELIIYSSPASSIQPSGNQPRDLSVTHCILPKPGSLVLFTVPRFHRVCRVDAVCGDHARLSIAGWFMTEHPH
ncbi:MAG: 2OG-Fe(II) oxygenase family protein [Nitrospirales bacterium]